MKRHIKGMSPKEMKDRRWLLDHNVAQVKELILRSGIQDAVGIVADMTGMYGRRLAMARILDLLQVVVQQPPSVLLFLR